MNIRFGDDGKLWHLGALLAVGITAWVVIGSLAYLAYELIAP